MSSLLLLIDGYNVIAPVAPPSRGCDERWLQRERQQLMDRLIDGLDAELRTRSCVVFDAADPPRDRPAEMTVDGLQVRFAVGYPEADDLIEALIADNSAPKNLTVVSSDHRVRQAASRRGCTVYDSQPWLDDLLDGIVSLAEGRRYQREQGRGVDSRDPEVGETINDQEVERWLREFGF